MDATSAKRETCSLQPSHNAPAQARRFVNAALSEWGFANVFTDVPLLASELVTNAVQHVGAEIEVSIRLERDRVRLEVRDQSEHPPVLSDLESTRGGGWGLHIVDGLAADWGIEPGDGAKTIWCEVLRPR